ncbi:MAG: TonB-dependent receptor plug domain-containing protein [Gemmatimonadaceae bacterium]
MSNRTSVGSLAMAAALAGAAPLAAQQPRTTADTARLNPVVVTATRTPVARDAAPASVTVLTGEELRAQGVARVADALRQVPGAAVAQSGSYGGTTTLFLRGGERDYAKVLVDGVPVNDAGGDFDFANLTTDNVERIEILRGPGSVLYGSDAVTGVIQIFTRRGAGRPRATLEARAGSYGTREGSAGVAGAAGALSYSLGGALRRTDGVLDLNNDYRNDALSGRVSYAPTAAADVALSSRYTEGTFHFPTDFTGAPTDSNQYTRERRVVTGLDAGYRFAPRLAARVLLADSRAAVLSDNSPDGPGDTQEFYSRTNADRYRRSADARLESSLAGATMTVGGVYEAESEESHGKSRFASFPESVTSFDERRLARAGYVQLVDDLGGHGTLTLGGRYDDNEKFGAFRTGRAGAALRLPLGVRVHGAAGNAFKEPAFSEVFSTSFTNGNPHLRPERSRSYEGGVEREVGRAVTVGATYFSQRFDDLVQYRPTAFGDTATNYVNVAAAKSAGVEAELRTGFYRGLAATAHFTYLDTKVLEAGFGASGTFVAGDALLRRPTRSGSLTLDYRPARVGSFAATVTHVGTRDDRDFTASPAREVMLPAYTTLDLGAALALPLPRRGPSVDVTFRLENLLDREYQSIYGYDAPGRVVLVGARVGSAR